MSANRKISRRRFLGEASCAAIGSTTFLSTALNLGLINTAAARPHIIGAPGDYKTLVVILLAGGADSHNFLVPTTAEEYAHYSAIRGDVALDSNNLLSITPHNTGGKTYGMHPGLAGLKTLFDNDKMAFIANIGTLIEPIIDTNDFYNGNKRMPLGLYSHADQIMQWQTSVPQDRSAVGVGGRMADMLKDMNTIDAISMNISLDGKNRFQSGNTINEYSISSDPNPDNLGIKSFPRWWSNGGFLTEQRNAAVGSLVDDVYSNIFQDTYADLTRQSIEGVELFRNALSRKPGYTTVFPNSYLAQDMRMMADVISVQQYLGAQRQIFFTTFGGWDHHNNVLQNQATMVPVLDGAMTAFQSAMNDLMLDDRVTTITISDFARTLTTNSDGSDHAWGGNSMIMGGAVNGGTIIGEYPELRLDHELNLDERGRYVPKVSVDELYAEIALWFGVSVNDLSYILPNIGNFNSYNSNPAPLGLFI
jgi:uncharacterized protein (DUF1501 family)